MRVSIVILALCGAGCFTTTHRTASTPFVHSVASNFDFLAVESCAITRTEQTHYNLFDMLFLQSSMSSTEVALSNETCHVSFIPLTPGAPDTPASDIVPAAGSAR